MILTNHPTISLHKKIATVCSKAAISSSLITLLFSIILAAFVTIEQVNANRNIEIKRLNILSPIVTRAIEGELLVDNNRGLSATIKDLQQKFDLKNLTLTKDYFACQNNAFIELFKPACIIVKISAFEPNKYIKLVSVQSPINIFSLSILLLGMVTPILLFGFLTTRLISTSLRRSIVKPIEKLALNPESWSPEDNSGVAEEVVDVHKHLTAYLSQQMEEKTFRLQLESEKFKFQLASQVAHDIRSPLAALNIVIKNTYSIPEEERIIIFNATQQITDIANNLLSQHRKHEPDNTSEESTQITTKPELVFALIDNIISTKRAQYLEHSIEIKFNITESSYSLFANLPSLDFKRVLSNLINNAVESISDNGIVNVSLHNSTKTVSIIIKDNGCGMTAETLEKAVRGGISLGKKEGHGLGLASSKLKTESWGGKFYINSQEDEGTTIILEFPIIQAPEWFQTELCFRNNSAIIILDDDRSIHDVWKTRFKHEIDTNCNIQLLHFDHVETFLKHDHAQIQNSHYLIDYELLGSQMTGLDIIEKLNIEKRATLVTSRYEDNIVRARIKKMNCKILPKNYSPFIPLVKAPNQPDLILIDDDHLLATAWKMSANNRGHHLLTFSNTTEARRIIPLLSQQTPIYIDSQLSNDDKSEKGEIFAKELYDLGFHNLYLATGYCASQFKNLTWIKGFVGKEYPV